MIHSTRGGKRAQRNHVICSANDVRAAAPNLTAFRDFEWNAGPGGKNAGHIPAANDWIDEPTAVEGMTLARGQIVLIVSIEEMTAVVA